MEIIGSKVSDPWKMHYFLRIRLRLDDIFKESKQHKVTLHKACSCNVSLSITRAKLAHIDYRKVIIIISGLACEHLD